MNLPSKNLPKEIANFSVNVIEALERSITIGSRTQYFLSKNDRLAG